MRNERNSGPNALICGTIFQYFSECQVKTLDPKYLSSCGSGTKTTTSKIKKYGLDILGMEVEDFTISRVKQCSTTGVTKAMAYDILSVGWWI